MWTYVVLILLKLDPVFGGNVTDKLKLKEELTRNYDKTVIPTINQSKAIQVNLSLGISYFIDLDEVQGKLSAIYFLTITWYDELMTWNPRTYGNISSIVLPMDKIWSPPLLIGNGFNSLSEMTQGWEHVRILSDGLSTLVSGNVLHTICRVSVFYFPFDNQTCYVVIALGNLLKSEIDVQITNPSGVINTNQVDHGEWELISSTFENIVLTHDDAIVFATLHLKRKALFMFVNSVVPILFMSVLALLVFALPVESGERMSYIITVVLAIAVFLTMIGENLPEMSYPVPLICFYLTAILTITACICFMTVLNLKLYYLDTKGTRMPVWCQKMAGKIAHKSRRNYVLQEQNNDKDDKNVNVNDIPCEVRNVYYEEKNYTSAVTWRDLSSGIDTIALVTFSSLMVICHGLFLGMLAGQIPLN